MANTTTTARNVINIVGLDVNWDLCVDTSFESEVGLVSIMFEPSAANDVFVVREGSATGPIMMKVSCTDGNDQKIHYFGGALSRPYIKIADCTLGTAANAMVIIIINKFL